MDVAEVSFDEWFETISSLNSHEEQGNVDVKFFLLPPPVVAAYLRRLLTEAHILCRDITPLRLSHMIWFFNGVSSSYWHEVRKKEVPQKVQVATVRAVGNFYQDFLDHFPLGDTFDATEAETAVYMMWDMDGLTGAAMFPGEVHLIEPIFEVLGIALRCKSFGCQRSALHGLGHLQHYHPARVEAEIDWALKKSARIHPALKPYAQQARRGMVQ